MDNLVRITKNINFGDLRSGRKKPIDVYEEQMESWIFRPLDQLAVDKSNSFENGYAMLGIELLFFEPHGKYLSGSTISGSRNTFNFGFDPFMKFLNENQLVDPETNHIIQNTNFYRISRCGIFHDMTIKSGLLIDSIHMEESKVFYPSPVGIDGILVSPWNFKTALKDYLTQYIYDIRQNPESDKATKFLTTFQTLFQY